MTICYTVLYFKFFCQTFYCIKSFLTFLSASLTLTASSSFIYWLTTDLLKSFSQSVSHIHGIGYNNFLLIVTFFFFISSIFIIHSFSVIYILSMYMCLICLCVVLVLWSFHEKSFSTHYQQPNNLHSPLYNLISPPNLFEFLVSLLVVMLECLCMIKFKEFF